MKRTSGLLLIIISIMILTGCSFPVLRESSATPGKTSDPEFTVDQVVLSQGFQNTEPRIELVRQDNRQKLLVSPGVLQSTGMEVLKIEKVDGVFNIHLMNSSYSSADLVIPQITILLSNVTQTEAESLKFKIVNENYSPITINYGIVDVLNKIRSDYRISYDGYPSIKLVNSEDGPIWVIDYENIHDRSNLEIPLIDLRLKVNSSTGEVVESTKSLISAYVDEGSILDFIPGQGMLYRQKDVDNENVTLRYYSIPSGEKTDLYRTQSEISYASMNPDGSSVVLLEKEGDKVTAFALSLEDRKAVRIGSEVGIHPERATWISNSEIQLITAFSGNQTEILVYNTQDGSLRTTHNLMMDLATFSVMDDTILASQFIDEETNNRILLSNGISGLQFVDIGFRPQILTEDLGMHLVNDKHTPGNRLHLFDLETMENKLELEFDVVNANRVSPNELLIVERLPGSSSFGLHILDYDSMEVTSFGSINTSNVYLDRSTDTIYVNDSIAWDSEPKDIIYTVKLQNLKKR